MGNRGLRIALRVLLVLSLLVNFVLLGLFLRLNTVRTELGFSGGALSHWERMEFQRSAAADPALRAALGEMRVAREAMFEILAADVPDRAAAEAAMTEVRRTTDALQVELQRIVIDVVIAPD